MDGYAMAVAFVAAANVAPALNTFSYNFALAYGRTTATH